MINLLSCGIGTVGGEVLGTDEHEVEAILVLAKRAGRCEERLGDLVEISKFNFCVEAKGRAVEFCRGGEGLADEGRCYDDAHVGGEARGGRSVSGEGRGD